jgi:hypothetical protein
MEEKTDKPDALENPVSEPQDVTEEKDENAEETGEKREERGEKREERVEEIGEKEIESSIEEYDEDDEDEDDDHDEEHEEASDTAEEETDYEQLGREELVSKLEELVQQIEIPSIKSKVSSIKVAFLKRTREDKEKHYKAFIEEGGDEDDYKPAEDPLNARFEAAFQIYKQNKANYLQELEKKKLENLEKKNQILEKLKELISSDETLKKTYDDFSTLQDEWKNIGLVPSGEVSNLWQSYHFLVEKFFDKVKINKELRDLDLKKNLEAKVKLCEQTEELLLESSIIKSFKDLQKYHEEWKEIGPVPNEKREEIWERFKTATDKINERRREHYEKLHEEQQKNLEAKTALCEKAEELIASEPASIREWQGLTREINELFSIWRTIGRAPKKENNEVWNRFKSSLNTFFSNKKEFLQKIKEEQLHNYNLKIDLCVRAENIKNSTEWKKTTQDLIKLQQEWKKIGPVPRKHSDKIWKRFRAACDEFFEAKSAYFSNIHEHEAENLKKKQEILEQISNHEFGDDKNENLNVIKEYQRKWMEIGFVPIKQKEKLQNEFRKVVDNQLNKLKINSVELQAEAFKTRYESVKGTPEGNRMMMKEQNFLAGKINKLREEINLWENNIGFLANSQKANVLKAEFEKKIDKAKKDLALMEAKLKYLRQS